MQTRTLHNGLKLTELGLGLAQFGNLYRETTPAEAEGAIEAAWASGIRYFDTAPHYGLGLSERRAGALLASRPREDFVISTKVGRLLVDNPHGVGQQDDEGFVVEASTRRQWDFSRDGIRRSIEASLTRLGLDRIDIAYLHDPDDFQDQATAEALPALIEMRDEGMLGAIGAGMNQADMLAHFIRESDIDIVMVAGRYTLLNGDAISDLLPLAAERGVGVVVAGVYNSGLLATDRPRADAHFDYAPAPPALIQRANDIAEVCERHGVTLPQVAMAYPLRHPAVVSVVVGARTDQQVASNVDRFDTAIPDALWTDLQQSGFLPEHTETTTLLETP